MEMVAADRITVINGSRSLINHLMIKSAGKIVYDTDNLHNVVFNKNLLKYSDDYSRTVAKSSLWYLDTDGTPANTNRGFEARKLLTQAAKDGALNAGGKDVNVILPLNRYSRSERPATRAYGARTPKIITYIRNDAALKNQCKPVREPKKESH